MSKKLEIEHFSVETEKDFINDFKELLSLNAKDINLILDILNTKDGFDDSDKNIKKIKKLLKLDDRKVNKIINVSKYLFNRAIDKSINAKDLIDGLKDFCKSRDIKWQKNREKALKKFFTPKKEYENHMQKELYANAVNYCLTSIACIHDIRTVFADNKTEILSFVPVYQIRMILKNSSGDEKSSVFQMDVETFDKFLKKLQRFKKQMNTLKKELKGKLN